MLLRIFMFVVALLPVAVFAEPGAGKRARLNAEIAAIEAKGGVASPAFETELREWEAMMAARDRDLPANISATLALEPSEREPQQRKELAEFFRPKSKVFAAAAKEIEGKRVQLAKLKSPELPITRGRISHRLHSRDSE